MSLPKIQHPTRKLTIPSTGEKVAIRPFTVREEKILLIAHASKESEDISDAMKQVITNCVTTTIDVDKLAMFDIEYLFVKLRAFSVNNIIELQYTDEEDNTPYDIELDLNDVEVKFNPEHKSKIELTDEIGVVMRYPDLRMMRDIRAQLNSLGDDAQTETVETLFSIYAKCIEKVWDNDGVAVAGSDFTEEEAREFLESLPSEGFESIQKFFETMPTLSHTVNYMTKKGEVKSVTLSGLDDFFL